MNTDDDKKLTRALILNALVLPGSGHVLLGSTAQGVIMGVATIVFLLAPIIRFMTAFSAALNSQPPPGVSGSLGIVAAIGQAWGAHWEFIIICLMAVLIIWVYGISDIALRIRRGRTVG